MNRRQFIRHGAGAALLAGCMPAIALVKVSPDAVTPPPSLCIFSKHLQWLDYREMAVLARTIGFTGIDLTVREGGHVEPGRVEHELPLAVGMIREEGLDVPMITTGITDPEDPLTRRVLEVAGSLGIPLYRTGWYRYREGEPVAGQLEKARAKLHRLQDINRANRIAASYQNHAGNYIGSSGWDLLRIIEGLDPCWTGVQFDIRHAMVEGPETWPVVLELLAPHVNSLDIKDYSWVVGDGSQPVVQNVPLGEGLVPFGDFVKRLEALQISADISLHCEYPLGGAEHGSRELEISEEEFTRKVRSDLDYLKDLLSL